MMRRPRMQALDPPQGIGGFSIHERPQRAGRVTGSPDSVATVCRRANGLGVALGLCSAFAGLAGMSRAAPVEQRVIENRIVQLLAPAATTLAVGDASRSLALGLAAGKADALWLLRLDSRGNVVADPPRVLALPADPAGQTGFPAGLIFHPAKPRLYVWRHYGPADATVPDDFDHLVVFDLSDAHKPVVAGTFARGEAFAAGVLPAHLAMDPEGRRLFVPNLRIRPARGAMRAAVGYFPLDGSGLPLIEHDAARIEMVDVADFQPLPTGRGFLAANAQVLLMAVQSGVLVWDTVDRRAGLSRVLLAGLPGRSGFLGGDADRLYWVVEGGGALRVLHHAAGYPSLLPQAHVVAQAAFRSPPLRMGGTSPVLAVGGQDALHLVGLTPDGGFSGEDAVLPLTGSGRVAVLGYSPLFERLYLPVAQWP